MFLRFGHVVFVHKKCLFLIAQTEPIDNYFYNRQRKANVFLSITTVPIYWCIEYFLWTGNAWQKQKNQQNLKIRSVSPIQEMNSRSANILEQRYGGPCKQNKKTFKRRRAPNNSLRVAYCQRNCLLIFVGFCWKRK